MRPDSLPRWVLALGLLLPLPAWAASPTASNGSGTTAEDTAVNITMRASDTDGDVLSYSIGTEPTHGSVTTGANRATYTPEANYFGTDSFTFRARDSAGNYSGYATITVTITAVNDAPVVSALELTTPEDTAGSVALSASDVDGDAPLTYALVAAPANGTVTLSRGVVTYTPGENYNGTDAFSYTATDPSGAAADAATVSVSVTAVNDPPTANDQSVSVEENGTVQVTLSGGDVEGHSLSYAISATARHGTVSLSGKRARYTPDADYSGADSFTFTVSDGVYAGTGTVTLTVVPSNNAPVATSVGATTNEDTSVSFTLPSSDADGDVVTAGVVRAPTNGTVTVSGTTASYTPNADWSGSDSFTWRVSDGAESSNVARANVTVLAVNDAPVASAVTGSCDEDSAATIRLTASDVDGHGTTTYRVSSTPANGSVLVSGSVATYRPRADFNGTDSFTYVANDGAIDSAPATVTVSVRAINDAPVAWSSYGQMPSSADRTFTAERSDVDSATVSWVVDSQPAHGRVYATSGGFHYTGTTGYYGKDRWTWHASDGALSSAVATFEVNVHPPPTLDGRPEMPQVGLNKLNFGMEATEYTDMESAPVPYRPSSILADLAILGAQMFRQGIRGDLIWSSVEPTEGAYNDADLDDVATTLVFEPTLTWFEAQYASPTPPWCTDLSDFQKYMGPDTYDYMDHMLAAHRDDIGYYEIGNEMYHWVAADPPVEEDNTLPTCYPTDGYAPADQAVFIEEASRYVKEADPGAILTLSSVATDSPDANAWLDEVIGVAGDSDWFDIVSYHSYASWQKEYGTRDNFTDELALLGLQDKLVKLTEYGSSSDADFTERTDYPNSDATQAADIFRMTLIAWGFGDATTIWHTYMPVGSAQTGGDFQGFEIAEYDGGWKPSAYAYQLMTSQLVPFQQVTSFSGDGRYAYRVTTTDAEDRWIYWGEGETATLPSGVTEYTSVVPDDDGNFDWIPCGAGDVLTLSDIPILVR